MKNKVESEAYTIFVNKLPRPYGRILGKEVQRGEMANLLKDATVPHAERGIWLLRILHLFFSPIALLIAVLMLKMGYGSVSDVWSAKIIAFDFVFTSMSIVLVWISADWIRNVRINAGWPKTGIEWIIFLGRRHSMLAVVTTSGVILAYIGGAWPIWTALIISSGVIQVLTYPSDKRLKEWLQEAKDSRH